MKTLSPQEANAAMTLIEVLAVLAILAVLIALFLPMRSVPDGSIHVGCMNNLRQIGLSSLIYAGDNHDKFPIRFSMTNGGTMEYLDRNQTFPHYQKFLGNMPTSSFLVCPADKTRIAATNFTTLTDTNISYFLSADVSTNNPTQSILSGDRHLQMDGQPVHHGTLTLPANMNVAWTPELHMGRGGLGFADGHVEFCRATNLNALFKRQGLATTRLSVP
jgi:prepilin-type N-terminal cleavage/methylation domain-containing protein/prepilin-type processing-associated H-X9-DG protein